MSKIYNSNNPYELEQFCNLVSECILQKNLVYLLGLVHRCNMEQWIGQR